jgi:hypothetical protein
MQQIKHLTDPLISFAIPLRILPPKVSKINNQCVMIKGKWNRMYSFTLNVGHRNLYKERKFLWRGMGQILIIKSFKNFSLFILDVLFKLV